MKRLIVVLNICFILLLNTGCKNINIDRSEINNIDFIRAIGIDKSDNKEGYVKVTITSERISKSGGGQAEQKESFSTYSEGRTVFEAINGFYYLKGKRPFLGHLEYVLIGEDAAKEGISKYLDFFSRDHELRLNLYVLVAKGSSAEDVLIRANRKDMFVFDRLGGLIENIDSDSISMEVKLVEIMRILDFKYISLYIPTIELVKHTKSNTGGKDAMDIRMGGFAFFDVDKLEGFLDDKKSRGLKWMKNKVLSETIVVKSPNGNNISLEIINSKVKIKPQKTNDKLSIIVDVEFRTGISEIQSTENIFNNKILESLNKQQQSIVRDEIKTVIEYAQEKKLDIFNVGSAVFHKYPITWEDEYKHNWETIFSDMEFNVAIKSNIVRTYDIEQPNGAVSGEK